MGVILYAYCGSMTGADEEFRWPPPAGAHAPRGDASRRRFGLGGGADPPVLEAAGASGRRLQGPRWIVSIRALIVVLAMLAAALGFLWFEAASVQGVSAELSNTSGSHITVPTLSEHAVAPGAPAELAGSAPAGSAAPPGQEDAGTPREPGAASPVPGSPQGGTAGSGSAAADTDGILVHVVGAVNNPGVFLLSEGSRIYQAVDAAGGALPTAQLAALNLAAPVSDGLQIVVLTQDQAAQPHNVPGVGASATEEAARSGPEGPLNINAATAADLDDLPGIGPVLADRIVAWRTDHGPYPSIDALDAVSGIGAKLLENLRSLVSVS